MAFHLTCVHIIFSSDWVAEWPPFGKLLLTRLTICFLCIFLVISRFGFEGWIWVLIAEVPDLCIRFTFIKEFRHRLDFELTLLWQKAKIITL